MQPRTKSGGAFFLQILIKYILNPRIQTRMEIQSISSLPSFWRWKTRAELPKLPLQGHVTLLRSTLTLNAFPVMWAWLYHRKTCGLIKQREPFLQISSSVLTLQLAFLYIDAQNAHVKERTKSNVLSHQSLSMSYIEQCWETHWWIEFLKNNN